MIGDFNFDENFVKRCNQEHSVGTTELCHSTKKRQHSFHMLKAFLYDTHQSIKTSNSGVNL